jgi:Ca2+-binding RTX toxin-like protein
MATTTKGTSNIIAGDGSVFAGITSQSIREYSNFGDVVDLTNNNPSNLHTRMLGGADVVTLSNANVGGFSNKVNGNLGNDTFLKTAGSTTRDFVLGGRENDVLNFAATSTGGDWQNGNQGDDVVIGATGATARSILRGGSGNDKITISAGSNHIAIGDSGKDTITIVGAANGRVVCRTDGDNAAQNKVDADEIVDFAGTLDKVYIPGINSITDLKRETVGADTWLKASAFTNGTSGTRYIVKFKDRTDAQVKGYMDTNRILIGVDADNALAALNPTTFLNDPNLGGLFA